MGGLIYEPRYLWDQKAVTVTDRTQTTTVVMDTNNFYNGSKHPVELDHVIVCPINYARKFFADPTQGTPSAAGYNALSNIFRVELTVSAKWRQSYSRLPIVATAYAAKPTHQPSPSLGLITDLENAGAAIPSSFWGVVYKKFTKPLMIPQDGAIEFDLTGFDGEKDSNSQLTPAAPIFYTAFHEVGGILSGNSRYVTNTLPATVTAGAQPFGPVLSPVTMLSGNTTTGQLFPTTGSFPSRSFRGQSPSAEGSSKFYGMSVMINQISYDNINTTVIGGVANTPMAMLATRVGCRAKCHLSGTQEWWWRPGAPLALVFDTITPGMVLPLDKKITLGPGDGLEVEVQFPNAAEISIGSPPTPTTITATYQLGVSVGGYAVIEG